MQLVPATWRDSVPGTLVSGCRLLSLTAYMDLCRQIYCHHFMYKEERAQDCIHLVTLFRRVASDPWRQPW